MNNQDDSIKTIFDKAADLVKDLPQNLQEKAFELAVAHLSPQNVSNSNHNNDLTIGDKLGEKKTDFFGKLQEETGISTEHLKSIYKEDKDGEIKIVTSLTGNAAAKQRLLAYLYLFGARLGNGEEWVSALKFAKKAQDYGVNDGHISDNLSHDRENILQGGHGRGKEYALTPNGVLRAKELLKGMSR